MAAVAPTLALVALATTIAIQRPSVQSPTAPVRDSAAQPSQARDSVAARAPGAPVIYQGDTLFSLYGALGPFSAAERAAAVATRLSQLGGSFSETLDTIRVVDREMHSELVVRDQVLMTVLDADAEGSGRTRAAVAAAYAETLRSALSEGARRLSARAVAIAVASAVMTTLALFLVLRLMGLGFRRLYRRLEAVRRLRAASLRIQRLELASSERLSWVLLTVARAMRIAVTVLLFYIYVPLVLSFFPLTAPLSRRIVGYALAPLGMVWHGLVGYVPNLFYIAVILLVARYVLKLIHLVFEAVGSGAITIGGFYPEWAEPTYKITRVLVLAFTAVVVFPYLPGSHTDAFKGVSIFLGVLFSLGSSSAVSNVVAGSVLTYTRAFRIGDRVRIGDTVGDVTEKTLLVTRVRTIKNVEVTLPNASVLSSQVMNYTALAADRGLILNTTVTIGYDVPWTRVHEMLATAARRTEHIATDPAPFVMQTSLDDFYVSYELNAYTNRPEIMALTYSRLHANIQDAFNEQGVEIMSPHYGALRDGNASTVPVSYLGHDYVAPAFRVRTDDAVKRDGAND